MRVERTSIFALLCFAVAAVFGAAATAQEALLTAPRPDGSGLLVWTAAGDAARLELPDGASVTVPLPGDSHASALAAVHDGWILAGSFPAADGSRRLFLRRGSGGGAGAVGELPAPDRDSSAPIRRSPVLLVDGGKLAGVAWLEGDGERSLGVRAAAWDGRAFRAPERVSEVGPGTQTALAGTVLADGSWMLVWTAFDGEDDEVVWSRRVGDAWLPVRVLGAPNAVPDVVPAVTPAGLGALAAWSRFDGEGYVLVGARFDGDGWTELPWRGPPGSLYPSFHPGQDGPRLLYTTARPRGWSVMHLGDDGRELHREAVTSGASHRPVLEMDEIGGTP